MTLIRKNGNFGKICSICKVWKMLADFPLDKKPGRFKGYRQDCCKECMIIQKEQAKQSR